MKIGKNTTVSINYTLKDSLGHLLEDTEESGPVSYLHGRGLMIPRLEESLEGSEAGSTLTVSLSPDEAYGERDDQLVMKIPRTEFDDPDTIELGEDIQVHDGSEGGIMTVVDIDKEHITLDGNHPFAGKSVVFNVSVLDVRETTKEDLDAVEHHHECGCGHDHGHGKGQDCDCEDDDESGCCGGGSGCCGGH